MHVAGSEMPSQHAHQRRTTLIDPGPQNTRLSCMRIFDATMDDRYMHTVDTLLSQALDLARQVPFGPEAQEFALDAWASATELADWLVSQVASDPLVKSTQVSARGQ
jgi:hypothetical protein